MLHKSTQQWQATAQQQSTQHAALLSESRTGQVTLIDTYAKQTPKATSANSLQTANAAHALRALQALGNNSSSVGYCLAPHLCPKTCWLSHQLSLSRLTIRSKLSSASVNIPCTTARPATQSNKQSETCETNKTHDILLHKSTHTHNWYVTAQKCHPSQHNTVLCQASRTLVEPCSQIHTKATSAWASSLYAKQTAKAVRALHAFVASTGKHQLICWILSISASVPSDMLAKFLVILVPLQYWVNALVSVGQRSMHDHSSLMLPVNSQTRKSSQHITSCCINQHKNVQQSESNTGQVKHTTHKEEQQNSRPTGKKKTCRLWQAFVVLVKRSLASNKAQRDRMLPSCMLSYPPIPNAPASRNQAKPSCRSFFSLWLKAVL